MNQAYVTVLSSDNYLPGVLALAKNIRDVCKNTLLVLTPYDLRKETYDELRRKNIKFISAPDIEAPDQALRATKEHPWYSYWTKTLFKLRIFDLVDYDKIVFVDGDMMLLESIDELFKLPDMSAVISGKSYPGNEQWVDLNSGLMVIEPQKGLSKRMAALIPAVASEKRIFGDQDIIQAFFDGWRKNEKLHIPEGYNVFFEHYHHYQVNAFVKVIHFVGERKPWMMNALYRIREYIRCVFKGNAKGIPVLYRYFKLIKKAKR